MGSPGRRGVLLVVGAAAERGGLQLRMRELGCRLAERGWEVTLVSFHPALRVRRGRDGPLQLLWLPCLAPWTREQPAWRGRANTAVSVAVGVAAAWATARRWAAVYAAGLVPEGLVAVLAARPLGRPCVVDTWLPGPRGNVARLLASPLARPERRLPSSATAVMAATDEVAAEVARAGFPPRVVRRVNWGVDLARFRPPTRDERATARRRLGLGADHGVVCYAGRFELGQKRLDVLLDAWARRPLPGWQLVLAGDGPDAPAVRAQASGLAGVRVVGWLDDVRLLLWAADAFVLPTEYETTGRSMVEAMACGLTGVVSATTGYRQMAPEGVAIVPNEPAAWASGLAGLADPERRAAAAAAARRWVSAHHDLSRTMDAVEALLAGAYWRPGRRGGEEQRLVQSSRPRPLEAEGSQTLGAPWSSL